MSRIAKRIGHEIWHGFIVYGAVIAASYGDPRPLQEILRDDAK